MTGTRGGGGGSNTGNGKVNGGGAVASIPQGSRKVVQSLMEIVNCPEAEIYAMLKECNMDPNEAVSRLLSQDPFHQVKSKREKKKENKDITDPWSRSGSSTSNRGGRGGNDRYGHAIPSQFASSDSGGLRAKPSYTKDNGATNTSSSSGVGVVGNNINRRPPAFSEIPVENKALTANNSDAVPSLHQSSGIQSPWLGVPGQVSMADIVKMGRPHGRGSSNVAQSHQSAAHHHVEAFQFAPTPRELYSSQSHVAKVSDADVDLRVVGSQNIPKVDDWPETEQPSTVSMPLVSEPPVTSEPCIDSSRLPIDRNNHQLDEIHWAQDALPDSRCSKMQGESSGSAPILNDELHDSMNSYRIHRHPCDQQEVEDVGVSVSSVATNIQQLSLSKEEEGKEYDSSQERDSPAVKIPGYLQVQSADCSHLSFGSFGSGMGAPLTEHLPSRPPKFDVEEASTTAADDEFLGHLDARNSEYFDDEHLRTASDANSDHRLAINSGSYDMPSASQSEMLKQEAPEVVAAPGNEYSFPSTNYTFENSQHLNPSFSHSQMSSQMQNLPPLSGIMSYSNSLPSSLLPSNANPARDAELSYSPFPFTQSMPTKFGSSAEAFINGPNGNISEALKTGNLSSPQLTQNISGSGISGGLTFPQHLPMHPYSQSSLPFANVISYPLLPQNYPYMPPSAFQQAIAAAGNSTSHQPLSAGGLPQYKNSVSASSLPQSATLPSGYGSFGNASGIPGNFSLNPTPAAAPASSINYEDILSSQYKDAAHLLALQQGLGSRTMQAVPASTYYSMQGQSQQPAGYRQSQQQQQQLSQQYGNLGGYQNFYHSQNGVQLEHQQQQMSRDGLLAGSQGQQPPKQPQQIWQNSY